MTRLEIEKEILQILGLLDPNGNPVADATSPVRVYVVSKINAALESVWNDSKWEFRRREFGVFINEPISGTMSFTKGAKTAIVSGQTPAATWIGCHFVLSNGEYPVRVESYSGQNVTFVEPINLTTNPALSFTMYFDGFMLPENCQTILEKTMKLSGNRQLQYMNRPEFQRYTGYFREDTDYHFVVQSSAVVQRPDIGQPIVYTSWGSTKVSNKVRRICNLYPYPDRSMSVSFDGHAKPTSLDSDSDVPDIPEQFHRSVLLPRIKLEMCDYPGFELSAGEKATAQQTYGDNLGKMADEDRQDPSEIERYEPSSIAIN